MSLDLSPQAASILEQEASRAGISVDTLIERTFTRPQPAEDTATRVQGLLSKWQAEYGLPTPRGGFKTLAQLSAEWQAEDEQMTEAEREADRQFWVEFEQRQRQHVQI